MKKIRWAVAFVVLGLLVATPSFADSSLESMIREGDHQKLEAYYAQLAQDLKTRADAGRLRDGSARVDLRPRVAVPKIV